MMQSRLSRAAPTLARRRALSSGGAKLGLVLPTHLKQSFVTPTPPGAAMVVANPFWKYPIAVVPPEPEVAPLITAIRELERRPFRIISHEDTSGRAFNASFFDDASTMHDFLEWYAQNALDPAGPYHECLTKAAAEGDQLPGSSANLVFGVGKRVLTDTRFGEYQLGMAVRYTAWKLRHDDPERAMVECSTPEFEERIAFSMQSNNIAYFGRLILTDEEGTILSAVRYGSLEDARRGIEVTNEVFGAELADWFYPEPETILGEAHRVLEM